MPNSSQTPQLFELSSSPSVANHYIADLRDVGIQKDSLRFRKNLERIGELLAYELSKTLNYQSALVKTPLGEASTSFVADALVLAVILRAGLPMYQGFLNVFDKAESAFVGAYRSPLESDNSFDIVQGYTATPDLTGKVLIMIDPMLATGKSVVSVYDSLLFHGKPKSVHLVSIIASRQGVNYLQKRLPEAHIWTAAIDEELNQKSYIVPGLGDAGDLAFGVKEEG